MPLPKVPSRVRDTTTTAGNGASVTLDNAPPAAHRALSVLTLNASFPYVMAHRTLNEFEEGIGKRTGATTFERTTVTDNHLGTTARVNFSAGPKDIFITAHGSYLDTLPTKGDKGEPGTNGATPDLAAFLATEGVELSALPTVTPTTSFSLLARDGNGAACNVLVSALQTLFGGTTPPAATVSSVTVSPSAPSVAGGASQTFTATVSGTNSPAQTVTWTANAGSITTGGVFTAPAATASVQTITITARSTVDTTKTGTATVTVAATGTPTPTVSSVTVSPSTANVAGGATQQFTATVAGTNSPSQGVNWTASAGSINASGLFTAPAATASVQTITITATSHADGTKSGTATVTTAAAAPTTMMADTFTLKADGTKDSLWTTSPQVVEGTSTDYYRGGLSVRVNVRDVSNVAASSVKFVWGKRGRPCPITGYTQTFSAGMNDTVTNHSNAYVTTSSASRWGSWADGATTSQYYGTFTMGSIAWFGGASSGQSVDLVLWAIFPDDSSKQVDNGTGTPLFVTITIP